ncbi:MAG: condensation domain-containing protein, partial [Candidatus Binatia bacterium]
MHSRSQSLTEIKRHQLQDKLTNMRAEFPRGLCIHHLLEAKAERTPDAIAIAAPGRTVLTYGRLYTQVEYVVKRLNASGVGRNDRVAIVLPNGPEMAVAFLAVAAGATSAPLNPAYRTNEFDFYLSDLNVKALIVQSGIDSPAIAVARKRGIPVIELSPVLEAEAGTFTLTSNESSHPVHHGHAQPDDVALVLHTSGTTSRPKMVPLTQSNILTSAHNIGMTLGLVEKDRCLNVMPLYHIHGLIGATLASLMAGVSIVLTPDFYASKFFDWMEEFKPTWYTAVPTMHQGILARARANRETIARSSLRFIRSSSAPLPPKVLAELEDLFKVPVIESYGMTEASHQITSNPLPPGERKVGSVGVAAGSEVAIMDEAGSFLSSGDRGEIVIRGANVTQGYDNNQAANRGAFINDWFRTGDQGYLDSDGYLFLTGRLTEMINRGGEKVSPREIDEALMDHPDIRQAAAFAVPHPSLGEDIAAAVVLRNDASVTERDIQRFAALRLADFKVPRRVMIVDEIPKEDTGKVKRIGLAQKLGLAVPGQEQPEVKVEFTAPRTPLEAKLAKIWGQVLRIERVGVHDNFFHLGGDSILAAQIISRVRKAMQMELSFLIFFETPTIAGMARSVESAGQAAQTLPSPSIQLIRKDGEPLPLSFAQQRMWFLDQLEPGSTVYIRPVAMRLTGPLDMASLEQTLSEILRRHEVLRATFLTVEGQPIQVITPPGPTTLPVIDVSELSTTERESRATMLAIEEVQLPFNLAQGPLLRATLLRLAEEEHVLLLVMHHIVFDGWSAKVLMREIAALYEAFSTGKGPALPELPIQYADFAHWQRQWLQREVLERQVAYWKDQLAGLPPSLNLPTDRPRPSIQTYRDACQSLTLSSSLLTSLKAMSQQESVTLFMTLLAAFQILLHRCTGQNDMVVGSPIAGRTHVETEGLIGFFVNTLVLRTDLSGNPSFRELLGQVREVALGAYAHQDLPFEKLVEELQPERDLGHTPLFQVMFNFENIPEKAIEIHNLRIEEFQIDSGMGPFDLTLEIVEEDEKLSGLFKYSTDLFDETTIQRLLGHFQTLLEGIVANPDQRLSDLPILTDRERQQLLVEWNDTNTDHPQDQCIHQLFEAQVKQTPHSVAVVFEDEQLTYHELNQRVNQLAHYLQKLGVGPDVLVGICMERSLEMVIGLLGVLKAGGAYVPLDPEYPKERLAFMMEDAQTPVLLTQKKLLAGLPDATVLQHPKSQIRNRVVVCMDTGWEHIARESEENPVSGATADNLAYV